MNKLWTDKESILKTIEENELIRRTFKAAFYLNFFYVFMVFMTSLMFPAYLMWMVVAVFFAIAVLPAMVGYTFGFAHRRIEGIETSKRVKGEHRWFKQMLVSYPIMILLVVAFLIYGAPESPLWAKMLGAWISSL